MQLSSKKKTREDVALTPQALKCDTTWSMPQVLDRHVNAAINMLEAKYDNASGFQKGTNLRTPTHPTDVRVVWNVLLETRWISGTILRLVHHIWIYPYPGMSSSSQLSESEPSSKQLSDFGSPASTISSHSIVFNASKSECDDSTMSAGSLDFDHVEDAQMQQFSVTEMPRFDLNNLCISPSHAQSLSYHAALSPHQQNGKRYHGGYLQLRVPTAAGLLKKWQRKYFRLREHGLVCYESHDVAAPLFEVHFLNTLVLAPEHEDRDGTQRNAASPSSEKRKPMSLYRTLSSFESLTLVLQHVEIIGDQKSAKKVEVPVFLKAENEADYVAWIECLDYAMEACKRTVLQGDMETRGGDKDTVEMSSPAQSQSQTQTSVKPLERPNSDASSQNIPRNMAAVVSSKATSPVEIATYQAFTSKYMLMKEIGEGSFSIVHRAVNRITGHMCAVKCCKVSQALQEEERLLRTLSHPNVVGLEGVYKRDDNLHYLVMDYLKDGDLCDLLIEQQRLPEPEARRIIRQAVEGLAYLHRRCVLHRDIKPENILIHGNAVKIADFGLAKELEQQTSRLEHGCGTLEYAAPELLCGRPYGLKSDVFSLGIVLYVLLFGAFPFSAESAAALRCMDHFPMGVDVRDMSCLSSSNMQWRIISPLAQDALLNMLKFNDTDRISAVDLLAHPWFDEADVGMSETTPDSLELSRIKDCEAMGFAELLSRGFQVIKYGYKKSTTPHSTSLSLNFMKECIIWTARKNPILNRMARDSSENATVCRSKRGRAIFLRDIQEIREGHTTQAFLSHQNTNSMPPPELCLSIICSWRTLDIVVEVPSQQEFMVRGLRRLLNVPPE